MGTFVPILHHTVVNPQQETRKRSLPSKKKKKNDPLPQRASKRTTTTDWYAQVAGIAQHPSSILLPDQSEALALPNEPIEDDSVQRAFPLDKLQTIDILVEQDDHHHHVGNQMFQTLLGSYRPMYRTYSPALQQTLIRNVVAFLRLQGVRFVMTQDGMFYECGTERLKRHIQELLDDET